MRAMMPTKAGVAGVKSTTTAARSDTTTTAQNRDRNNQRPYDLIVFGATGFTGSLAANYLAKKDDTIRYALAGRDLEKLQKVANKSTSDENRSRSVDVYAGSTPEELRRITEKANVVLSFAGPFAKFGFALTKRAWRGENALLRHHGRTTVYTKMRGKVTRESEKREDVRGELRRVRLDTVGFRRVGGGGVVQSGRVRVRESGSTRGKVKAG